MRKQLLTISMPPHASSPFTTQGVMKDVLIALIPAFLMAVWFFGVRVIGVVGLSVLSCMATEFLFQHFIFKRTATLNDLSAIVTGVLLAFNLPSHFPWWMIIVGSFVAIGFGKMCYGGLGHNPFNPALVGRVFLLVSFPVAMTSWPKPLSLLQSFSVDATTAATPLSVIKEGVLLGEPVSALMRQVPSYWDLFIGNRGGSLGEVSALALSLGFLYLLYRQIITWHIPVMICLTIVVFSFGLSFICPDRVAPPLFQLLTGGVILGSIFMATDYTTAPMTLMGMFVYSLAIGILTILIRVWGSFPEGMSFSILILNAFVPLIDKVCKPYRFGERT